mmetsp:Transcript_23632/g.57013  ORF Transcript_23632/g.57013 Transcript_23632/m.57013 type:complete len:701 (+) Transcript_23632:24-2126(+)
MSDTENDDDESTVYSHRKPHLDPRSVLALAASIPNCSRVTPPYHAFGGDANNNRPIGVGGKDEPRSSNANVDKSMAVHSESNSSYFSTEANSYFSQFSWHLQKTFSAEDERQERDDINQRNQTNTIAGGDDNNILSFLVSDAYSIERLAAEAEGRHSGTSELEGAGIARIDVYCKSGTVCTCRVIRTSVPADAAGGEKAGGPTSEDFAQENDYISPRKKAAGEDDDPENDHSSFMGSMLVPTPRKGNRTQKQQPARDNLFLGANTQVRRIIRRKCTLEALRRCLEQPPKLPEIDKSIISSTNEDEYSSAGDSQASTVSKELRKRQLLRQGNSLKQSSSSSLSKEQQKFLEKQKTQHEKRIKREEKVRMHVSKAILAGGMTGADTSDLSSMRSLSLDSASVGGGSTQTSDAGSLAKMGAGGDTTSNNGPEDASAVSSQMSVAYRAQKKIQDRIEIADMGLAILMGEAQRLERIMEAMQEEKNKMGEGEDSTATGSKSSKSKRSGRSSSHTTKNDDTDRSFSSFQSTDRSARDDESVASSFSGATYESEARRVARIVQGCEVEYSFPHEQHDELERALMGDPIIDDDTDESSSELDSEDVSRASSSLASKERMKANRRRGRSPARVGGQMINPIVAVPTNGEGCVILRKNGAFDVVGKIPGVLRKKLFRPKGPMPDNIALGTLGRYYVHFEDGSFFYYGPPR